MTKLRELEPVSTGSAADFIPPNPTLPKLREAARSYRGCDLWINATQTVFGEGPSPADVMFVGEAPGDLEDRAGHLFVGPAGKLLDTAMLEAGIDRTRVYVTNSVKQFKFVDPRGESAGDRRAGRHGCTGAPGQGVPGD